MKISEKKCDCPVCNLARKVSDGFEYFDDV